MTFEDIKRNIEEMPDRDLQYLYAVALKIEKTDPKWDRSDEKIKSLMFRELAERFIDQAEITL